MGSLLDFLTDHPITEVTKEVKISSRFKDAKGNILPFKIRAMSGVEYSEYLKQSQRMNSKEKVTGFDYNKYQGLIVIGNTIEPCFKDVEAIKKAGCLTAEQFLYKSLLIGEIINLADEITDLSGFNIDLETLREEAKNA